MKKEKKKDEFYKRNLRNGISITIGFIILGILFIFIMSYDIKKDLDFSKSAIATKGEIIDIEYRNSTDNVSKIKYQLIGDKEVKYISIKYNVDNVEYIGVSKDINSFMYIGKSINIYYNQEKPEQIKVINYYSNIIPIVLSLIFIIVGIIGSVVEIKKIIRYIETLNGIEIRADIVKVIEISKLWWKEYKIECTGKDEAGDTYTFYSRTFNEPYLEHEIEKMKINTLKVRYKKYNPNKYIVLTESLERRLSK